MDRQKIAATKELKEGQTLTFEFSRGGRKLEGFVARFDGQLVAYENKCRHLPISLDYGDGEFFSRDGKSFVCQNHNALYEPLTGLCTRGPCEGQSLKPLKIEELDGEIWLLS